MDTSILENIGLSKAEIRVYLALLELGSVPSGKIVKETGFRKSTVYESLGRLQEKGLVSYVIMGGTKTFEAAEPGRIISFLEEKKWALEKTEKNAKNLVIQLRKGFDSLKPHAEAHVLLGIEGFKTMRRDVLRNASGELMLLGAIWREPEVLGVSFDDWNKQRQKKKIHFRVLTKEASRLKLSTIQVGKYFQNRFLPKEIESPAVINIYGDRVVSLVWKGNYPLCFLLINKDIADAYCQYFDYLWKISSS